jgi:four helix bundle protein
MARDHRKLHVFLLADRLILDVYRATSQFPVAERYGLQSQLRRSAVSIAVNLVEGCARRSDIEYSRFVEIAFSSSRECNYLISLCARLALLSEEAGAMLGSRSNQLCAALALLSRGLEHNSTKA